MTITTEAESLEFWGEGPIFEVVLHEDVTTFHGNVVATAGRYRARQANHAPEGVITIWSPDHYAGIHSVSLGVTDWSFPDENQRPIPEHDCSDPDNWRSGVAGGIFCGVCKREMEGVMTLICDTCHETGFPDGVGEPCGRDLSEELDLPDGSVVCPGSVINAEGAKVKVVKRAFAGERDGVVVRVAISGSLVVRHRGPNPAFEWDDYVQDKHVRFVKGETT